MYFVDFYSYTLNVIVMPHAQRRSLRRAEDDWPPSGLEGGRSRNIQPVQIVRTPQHAVRQESYQQRSSYPVYETPSNENDDDYYSR